MHATATCSRLLDLFFASSLTSQMLRVRDGRRVSREPQCLGGVGRVVDRGLHLVVEVFFSACALL